jgi:hypothetical protein
MTYDGFNGVGFISIPELFLVLFVLKQDDFFYFVLHNYKIIPVLKTACMGLFSCYCDAMQALPKSD